MFQTSSNLKRHHRNKHHQQCYPCSICATVLHDKSNLKRHERQCATRAQAKPRFETTQLRRQLAPWYLRLGSLPSPEVISVSTQAATASTDMVPTVE